VVDVTPLGGDVAAVEGAVPVADLDGAAFGAAEQPSPGVDTDPAVGLEEGGLDVGGGQEREELAGGDDGAVGQFAQSAEHRLVAADMDRDEGLWQPGAWWCGQGAAGHDDEGVVAALGRGAFQLAGRGVAAEPLAGPLPPVRVMQASSHQPPVVSAMDSERVSSWARESASAASSSASCIQ
jgi:hypothetical protein